MICNIVEPLLILLLLTVVIGGVALRRTRRTRDATIEAGLARRKQAQLQVLEALVYQVAPGPITQDHLALLFDASTEELERWAVEAWETLYLAEAGDGEHRRSGDGPPNDGGETS